MPSSWHPCDSHIESCPAVQAAGGTTAEQIRADIERDEVRSTTPSLTRLIHLEVQARLVEQIEQSDERPALPPGPPSLDVVISHEYEEVQDAPADRQAE